MENIKKEFRYEKILLIYKCGSYAFGTSNEDSDEDFVVVLKDYRGLTHRGFDKKEYFIFGLDFWKDKMEFSDSLAEYYQIHNDEILSLPETIIYVDDEIKPLIELYKTNFISNYHTWLTKVVRYFSLYYELGSIEKRFYHLIRIKHLVENYKSTGVFTLDLSDEVKTLIAEFKKSTNRSSYKNKVREALEFLTKELEE